jgi:hypothetical protein
MKLGVAEMVISKFGGFTRGCAPLFDFLKDGVDLNTVQWAAH